ncbi:MAG: hypothetical protein P8H03_11810 [Emcibacteraceae bacterium]|nr:hypothetical protein [Emcibacteraceae bacterium]
MLPTFFRTGFNVSYDVTELKSNNNISGFWFPEGDVLTAHADMGIIGAQEMLANRLLIERSGIFAPKIYYGNFENVNELAIEYYRKASLSTAFSLFMVGQYELWSGDKSGEEKVLKAANLGVADAMFWLGLNYLTGQYIDQDLERSKFYFEKSVKAGSIEAIGMLGLSLKFGTYDEFDIRKSYEYIDQYINAAKNNSEKYGHEVIQKMEQNKLIYLTYFNGDYKGTDEYKALLTSAENDFRPAAEAMCYIAGFGAKYLSQEWIDNLNSKNFDSHTDIVRWCRKSAYLGDVMGAVLVNGSYAVLLETSSSNRSYPELNVLKVEGQKWSLIAQLFGNQLIHLGPDRLKNTNEAKNEAYQKVKLTAEQYIIGKFDGKEATEIIKFADDFFAQRLSF